MFEGIIGLVHLAISLWAFLSIIKSSATMGLKIIWIVLVLLLPVIGLIVWLLVGPKGHG